MSVTVEIPGGTAVLRDTDDLSVAQSRAIARAVRRIRREIVEAPEDGVKDMLGLPVDVTEDDLDASWEAGDVMILAMLESWTLDRPVPASTADVTALPQGLYLALQGAVAKLQRDDADKPDPFTVDAVEDPTSPTGA